MNKEEAIEKLLDFVNSLGSKYDSVTLNDRLFNIIRKNKMKPIGKVDGKSGKLKATDGDEGVFIFYDSYVGYYNYDFSFYRNFPRITTTGYSLEQFKRGIYDWDGESAKIEDGKLVRYYPWAVIEATYDITDLVMGKKQMALMNWKRPPF